MAAACPTLGPGDALVGLQPSTAGHICLGTHDDGGTWWLYTSGSTLSFSSEVLRFRCCSDFTFGDSNAVAFKNSFWTNVSTFYFVNNINQFSIIHPSLFTLMPNGAIHSFFWHLVYNIKAKKNSVIIFTSIALSENTLSQTFYSAFRWFNIGNRFVKYSKICFFLKLVYL